METTTLAPTYESGEWQCICGEKIFGCEVVSDGITGSIATAEIFDDFVRKNSYSLEQLITAGIISKRQKLCPKCNQPMFFEPFLKHNPPGYF